MYFFCSSNILLQIYVVFLKDESPNELFRFLMPISFPRGLCLKNELLWFLEILGSKSFAVCLGVGSLNALDETENSNFFAFAAWGV